MLFAAIPFCFACCHAFEPYLSKETCLSTIFIANSTATLLFKYKRELAALRATRSVVFSSFAHVDFKHLLQNFTLLALIWQEASEVCGLSNTFALYLSGGPLAISLSRKLDQIKHSSKLTVGSSGAVSTLLGSMLWNYDIGPILAPTGAIGLILTSLVGFKISKNASIDHVTHLVGALYGVGFCSFQDFTQRKF